MTDDKGAGDNPYFHDAFCVSSCMACRWKEGFTAGRKAERERCAQIAEKEVVFDIASLESGEFYSNSAGRIIAEKIRGGQDEK